MTVQGLHRRRLHGALEKIARGHGVEIVKDARVARWTPKVVDLIERTDPADLMRHDVHHLGGGPPTYARGRVVMVRDALLRMVPARALARAAVSAGAV